MNRPGIPAAGVEYLRRVTLDGMADRIQIRRPGIPNYDPVTGYAIGESTPTVGYSGPAHIYPQEGQTGFEPGEGMVAMVTVQISIPYDVFPLPRVDDQVYVTAASDLSDPSMVAQTLRILTISGGGMGFINRVLTCTYERPNSFSPGA